MHRTRTVRQGTRCVLVALCLALVACADALASHCMHRRYTQEESAALYDRAHDVFVGVLERIHADRDDTRVASCRCRACAIATGRADR